MVVVPDRQGFYDASGGPPIASADERLHEMVQETPHGSALASPPFYDRAKVVALPG